MTPRDAALKSEVGLRELRAQLSLYVKHAAEGREIVVTDRGRRVARLSALGDDPIAELSARGLVQKPERRVVDSSAKPAIDR